MTSGPGKLTLYFSVSETAALLDLLEDNDDHKWLGQFSEQEPDALLDSVEDKVRLQIKWHLKGRPRTDA